MKVTVKATPKISAELKNIILSGGKITIDTEMSDTSENAVQNKVIKAYVDNAIASIPTLPRAEEASF